MQPRTSARAASSLSNRVLPIPGSPTIANAQGRRSRSRSSAASIEDSSALRPSKGPANVPMSKNHTVGFERHSCLTEGLRTIGY